MHSDFANPATAGLARGHPPHAPRDEGSEPLGLFARLIDSFYAWRDRKLADPAFRRFSARFPLTRPIARKSATELFDLTAGFVYSQVLWAVVELDLLRLLAAPKTVDEVARAKNLPDDGARRLLEAAASLKLLSRRSGGRFGLGQLGAALEGDPGVKAMIAHHAMFYGDLKNPLALLRGEAGETALGRFWAYAGARDDSGALGGEAVAPYSRLMAESQSFVAGDVLDAFSLRGVRRLLDVAGGEGAFLCEAGRRWPELELGLFDLPAVAESAKARLAAAGLESRAQTFGGDLFSGALPAGFDLISLVRVLHDHDDDRARLILAAVHEALPEGGRILVAEPLAEMRGAERVGHAYFGLYLAAMGSGRPRTAQEIEAMLVEAGFADPVSRLTAGALPLGLVSAQRRMSKRKE